MSHAGKTVVAAALGECVHVAGIWRVLFAWLALFAKRIINVVVELCVSLV